MRESHEHDAKIDPDVGPRLIGRAVGRSALIRICRAQDRFLLDVDQQHGDGADPE